VSLSNRKDANLCIKCIEIPLLAGLRLDPLGQLLRSPRPTSRNGGGATSKGRRTVSTGQKGSPRPTSRNGGGLLLRVEELCRLDRKAQRALTTARNNEETQCTKTKRTQEEGKEREERKGRGLVLRGAEEFGLSRV